VVALFVLELDVEGEERGERSGRGQRLNELTANEGKGRRGCEGVGEKVMLVKVQQPSRKCILA